MSAFMRGVLCVVSAERNFLLTRRSDIIVESKRYVRGLRRKPVRVLDPENEPDKVVKPRPEFAQVAAEESVKKQRRTNVTSGREHPEVRDPAVKKSIQSTVKHAEVTFANDQLDGLRFERAFPGDKRLA